LAANAREEEVKSPANAPGLLDQMPRVFEEAEESKALGLLDEMPRSIDQKSPEVVTPKARAEAPQKPREKGSKSPGAFEPNTRGLLAEKPGKSPDEDSGLLDQMPETETLTDFENLDQSAGWDDLWRIEKDGANYKWRLRFGSTRPTRPGGRITPEIRKRLKARPGKGRHAGSRADAERLGRRAELAAIGLRPGAKSGPKGQVNPTNDEGRANARADHSDSERVQMPGMPELDQWNNMPDLPVM
jgi:hypothetical protein